MIGVMVLDIVLGSYAALTIYKTAQREVIMLTVAIAVGYILFRELSKRLKAPLKEKPRRATGGYTQKRGIDDFHHDS